MIGKMNEIRELTKLEMKSIHYRAKHYTDYKRFFRKFEVNNKAFSKVTPIRYRLKLDK